jgi:hypothetical protein
MTVIGIISDTHGDVASTQQALAILHKRRAEWIIHCGDITTAEVLLLFEGWQAAFVWGNMDRDRAALQRAAAQMEGVSLSDVLTVEIGGTRLAACHGDDAGQLSELIHSGLYRYVFHGHTHLRRDELIGTTRVINPGALGGKHKQSRSVCVLDLERDEVEFIKLRKD